MIIRNILEHWVVIKRRLMRAKMIVFCYGRKTETWMLVRCSMSLDGNLVRLLHWGKKYLKKF